jgi:hypothetical protein
MKFSSDFVVFLSAPKCLVHTKNSTNMNGKSLVFIGNIWSHNWPARESEKKSILGLVNHAEQAPKVNRKQKSEQNTKNSTKKDGGKWKTSLPTSIWTCDKHQNRDQNSWWRARKRREKATERGG